MARSRKFKPVGISQLLAAPPPGTYDPSLDAEESAAKRGLSDLESDTALGSSRALTDYGVGQQQLNRGRERGLADILTRRNQANEDFGRSTQGLVRNYARLGTSQAQHARQLGVSEGGATQEGEQKRAANQAFDQQGLDTSHDRQLGALDTAQSRLGEDTDLGLANLGLRFGRGEEDRGNQLAKAQRESGFFSQDVAANRFWQALNSGVWPASSTQPVATPSSPTKKPRRR